MAEQSAEIQDSLEQARVAFQRLWGYPDFRPLQAEVIRSLLAAQDTVMVLPTGAGKSLCFQLPAVLQQGLTLVISPLIALMENQVAELQSRRLPAAAFHGQLSRVEQQRLLKGIEQQQFRLLYLSPESLFSQPIWQRLCLPQVRINGLVIDEAHCLIEWGETFRPSYRRLGTVRPALLRSKPVGTKLAIAAFTATADLPAQRVLQTVLHLRQPQIFRASPYRRNLDLRIQTVWTAAQRRHRLWQFINAQVGSGLIYARTRRDCEELCEWLQTQGYPSHSYHAGLSAVERRQIERQWLSGQQGCVVCTNAFGMGINKPDCRWICHFQAPANLIEYVQQIGRAGRDEQPAIALTLISEPSGWLEPSDRQHRQFMDQQWRSQYQAAQKLIPHLPRQGDIRTLSSIHPQVAIALALLHRDGQLFWQDPFHYQIRPAPLGQSLNPIQTGQTGQQQLMAYLHAQGCRWQFLLQAFGFTAESQTLRCQHCDNCRRSS